MERIDRERGLKLFTEGSLPELQAMAKEVRNTFNPPERVTFTLNSNPNYTNICNIDCSFCGFYRHRSAKDTYDHSVEEVMKILERARDAGVITVLLQGGVHEGITADFLVTLLKEARKRVPEIHPHFFTAVEIWNAANVSGITIRELLQRLYDAGQRTIPGGGAEILSERVRLEVSPKKMGPGGWLDLHKTAHTIGFKSTSTMMYGHVETPEDILSHLDQLREAQDETGGFYSFVPWSYKRDRTALRRKVKNWAGRDAYYRMLAFSRIYLDNIPHIGASWFGEGKEIGIESLHYGGDDFGGILMEENVHKQVNFTNKTDHNEVVQMIRKAGFEPALRNEYYEVLQTYEGVDEVVVPELQKPVDKDYMPILDTDPALSLKQ